MRKRRVRNRTKLKGKYPRPRLLKLKRRSTDEWIDLFFKRGVPASRAIAAIADALEWQAGKPLSRRALKYRVEQRYHEWRSRITLRAVVRARALRKENATVRWLYACLADQHGNGNRMLDAAVSTLQRLYGWKPARATTRKGLNRLIDLGLIVCVKSEPHSKHARYCLIQKVQ